MPSHILWQNTARTITLLDVPGSIAAAQGNSNDTFKHYLLSSLPLQSPFPSTEPKTTEAKAKLKDNSVNGKLHKAYQLILERAIEEVKDSFNGEWCLPRLFVEDSSQLTKKRKLDVHVEQSSNELPTSSGKASSSTSDHHGPRTNTQSDGLDISVSQMIPASDTGMEYHKSSLFYNETDQQILVETSSSTNNQTSFRIPPRASFYLDDCVDSSAFHSAIRKQAQQQDTRKEFDFILLDPPWPNRSVRRTHKTAGSTYTTSHSLPDIRELMLDMKLDLLMADKGLVGVWITNKPAVRNLVLGEDGIFECWDVELIEEWLWLKTTLHGTPVTPLDALWRKPYEVLLLGRKRSKSTGIPVSATSEITPSPQRRVIIGVPDLHSRKPCLKELIEPFLSNKRDYRALEVFARHLVAGWWSWGNECIKFNRNENWKEESD